MITSSKLKIWTIATHGLIIIGAGHGLAALFMIEMIGMVSLIGSGFKSLFTDRWLFTAVALLTLVGQVFIVISNSKKRTIPQKKIFQISGLLLFWISVTVFWYATINDVDTVIVLPTAIPLLICTIITFFGKPIGRFRENFIDRIP